MKGGFAQWTGQGFDDPAAAGDDDDGDNYCYSYSRDDTATLLYWVGL